MSDNAESSYYIQNGFDGNAMVWWREGGRGYTTNLKEAGKYSEEEAQSIIERANRYEIAWSCSYIDNCDCRTIQVIDRGLDSKFRLK